jgi:hypothetical protein
MYKMRRFPSGPAPQVAPPRLRLRLISLEALRLAIPAVRSKETTPSLCSCILQARAVFVRARHCKY